MSDPEPTLASKPTHAPPAEGDPCLCLSGGGFRATLFHLGGLVRLNELGVLAKFSAITSVSGGSILNGVLATRWSRLTLASNGVFTNFAEEVADPVRQFCSKDLRTRVLLGTRLNPANWRALTRDRLAVSADFLADGYAPLYAGDSLRDLPLPGTAVPRFVFCATNVRTGLCWSFHGGPQARMGDFHAGYCDAGWVRVADAVAASSAFPPGFGALRLKVPELYPFSREDQWGQHRPASLKRDGEDHNPEGSPVLLTDGGVYDNLGVEPVWSRCKTMLVSDAGFPFMSADQSRQSMVPRLRRAAEISMEQATALRKRWFFQELKEGRRRGAVWTLNTRMEDFTCSDRYGYGTDSRKYLHTVRTDLNAFSASEIACLENHGYSLADAAVRSHAPALCADVDSPFTWPHPEQCSDESARIALSQSHRRRLLRDGLRYVLDQLGFAKNSSL